MQLLEVENLRTSFMVKERWIPAVDGVSFSIAPGESVGVVGESGSGKSVTMLSIMRLLPKQRSRIEGTVRLGGRDLSHASEFEMQEIRGKQLGMVFQDPMTSLNPLFSVGFQITEVLTRHLGMTKRQANERVLDLLKLVEISDPARRAREFPHQLSGGMRQRVMIAIALACNPQCLIADEPTTALDVTIQVQILDLLRALKERIGMAVVFITHDLGVVAEIAERVIVMYAGQIVEEGRAKEIFTTPQHPYTEGLLESVPTLNSPIDDELRVIPGSTPGLDAMPAGCRFHTRCPYVMDRCRAESPPVVNAADGRRVRCWLRT